jgi:hypothetical protein
MGFSIGQRFCDCPSEHPHYCPTGWKLIFANNRNMHKAKANYAPVEGKCLSATWSLNKSCHFILGCKDLILAIDHKPLVKVLGDQKLEHIMNPRLQSLKEKTRPFIFRVIHEPSKIHFMADALSIYASGDTDPERLELPDNTHVAWGDNTLYDEYDTEVAKMEEEQLCHSSNTVLHRVGHMGHSSSGGLRPDHVAPSRHSPDGVPRVHGRNAGHNMAVSPAQRRTVHL